MGTPPSLFVWKELKGVCKSKLRTANLLTSVYISIAWIALSWLHKTQEGLTKPTMHYMSSLFLLTSERIPVVYREINHGVGLGYLALSLLWLCSKLTCKQRNRSWQLEPSCWGILNPLTFFQFHSICRSPWFIIFLFLFFLLFYASLSLLFSPYMQDRS